MRSKFTDILSSEEIVALMKASVPVEKTPSKWFLVRSFYLLTAVILLLAALTVYRAQLLDLFSIEGVLAFAIIDHYIILRVAYVIFLILIYSYSYFKKWYFYYISFAAFVISIMNLVLDFSLGYIVSYHGMGMLLGIILGVRLSIIICLFLNFWECKKY